MCVLPDLIAGPAGTTDRSVPAKPIFACKNRLKIIMQNNIDKDLTDKRKTSQLFAQYIIIQLDIIFSNLS